MKKQPDSEIEQKHYEVDVRKIRPLQRAGGNPRTDYGDIEELAADILQNGVSTPLEGFRVKDDPEKEWEVVVGHRRLAACMLLVERGNKVRVKMLSMGDGNKISDDEILTKHITTNSGKQFNPVEQAETVRRFMALGYKPKEIAAKFGKDTHFISNLALLASAPKMLRDLVADNKVGYTRVLDLLKESVDFNAAVEKIKIALQVSKTEKVKEGKEKGFEVSEATYEKVTKRHIDIASNRVNSFRELEAVIRWALEEGKEAKNEELALFAKKLVNNNLTSSDIKELLFT